MKIACQSCQAKYTIADEKVLGRVVKIRCKKCGATIVINGNEAADPGQMPEEQTVAMASPNSRAFDYAAQNAEEPWTVNVGDGDQRTMSTADIVAQFKAGVVNDETYCWKDGMSDWLPLREIDALAAVCGLGAGAHAAAAAPAYAPDAGYAPPQAAAPAPGGLGALFGGVDAGAYAAAPAADAGTNGSGYGHAPAAAAPSAAVAARRAGGRAGGADLFGGAAEAGGENDVMTSAPQGAPAMHPGDGKLTGQRNENSVLFSLSALTQNAPKEEAPGPQGDGSGLIDIRALSATMAPQTKKSNHVDDIMNLGGGGAFSAALAAPVLAPPTADAADAYGASAEQQGKGNKLLFVLIGVGVLVAALLVVVLVRKPETPAATTAPGGTSTTSPPGTASGAVAANDTAAPTPTAAPTETGGSAAAGGAPPVDPTKPSGASAPTPPSGGGTHHASAPSGGGEHVSAPAAPVIPKSAGGGGSFDDMLKKAAGDTGSGSSHAAPSGGGGTEPFDRGAAAGALGAVNVAGCKRSDGPTGGGHVSVTFSPDGSVSSAVVDQPPFAGTAVGGCVAGKFRGAHIPAFSGGSVKVGKSFVIN